MHLYTGIQSSLPSHSSRVEKHTLLWSAGQYSPVLSLLLDHHNFFKSFIAFWIILVQQMLVLYKKNKNIFMHLYTGIRFSLTSHSSKVKKNMHSIFLLLPSFVIFIWSRTIFFNCPLQSGLFRFIKCSVSIRKKEEEYFYILEYTGSLDDRSL